jgi:FMN phosphatase YigB (HAD superfamily)
MVKIVLFDIDGVIIRHEKLFSDTLCQDRYPNAGLVLNQLYKTDNNKKCDKGELDIFEYIKSYLDEINWDKSVEDYLKLQYEFESRFIDTQLLKNIRELKMNDIITGIASNQNQYRKGFLLENLDVSNVFDNYYFSSDIGYVKSEDKYWVYVINNLKNKYYDLKNEEIMFLDDLEKNTNKAKEFGINSILIRCREDIDEIFRKIEERVV